MKGQVLIFAALCPTQVALAQQATTVQLECHDLSLSGNVLARNETLVNGMACHSVTPQTTTKQAAPAQSAPTPATTVQTFLPNSARSGAPAAAQPAAAPNRRCLRPR